MGERQATPENGTLTNWANESIVVCGDSPEATALARQLNLDCVATMPASGVALLVDTEGLALHSADSPASHPVRVDLNSPTIQRRIRSGNNTALARALGLHRRPGQSVIDATCGLARDSAVLLGLGCTVRAFERSPILAALIRDAIERLPETPPGWLGLDTGNAAIWLQQQTGPVADIVYIDPMFSGQRRNALPKKDMQLVRRVVGHDMDTPELLAAARGAARRRVVIKRHPRDTPLAQPQRSVKGKRACFDIYLQGDSERR